MNAVHIADNQNTYSIDRSWYSALARFVLVSEGVPCRSLSVAFVDNAVIHQLNRQFLAHDYPTDVLSFPLSEEDDPLVGEIVISTEYALEQSVEYGWPVHMEVGLYLVHGLLHLCNYTDVEPGEAERMRQRQRQLINEFVRHARYAGQTEEDAVRPTNHVDP